jgi:hypothetical protein
VTGSCTRRPPERLTVLVRTVLAPRAVRTARLDPVAAAGAGDGADAGIAGARCRLGTATCGKCAAGNDSAGIATAAAGASTAARIAPAPIAAYGSAIAVVQTTANQNRIRLVPRLLMPNVREVPEPCAPATAGLSRLSTITRPAEPNLWRSPPDASSIRKRFGGPNSLGPRRFMQSPRFSGPKSIPGRTKSSRALRVISSCSRERIVVDHLGAGSLTQ